MDQGIVAIIALCTFTLLAVGYYFLELRNSRIILSQEDQDGQVE